MQPTQHEVVPLAVTCENGDFVIHYFVTKGRGTFLPSGAKWATAHEWEREPNDANIEENLFNSFIDRPVVSWRRLSLGDIPADRSFRDAWKDDGAAIVHDIAIAKDIKRRHIRHERARALQALDGQWMRANAKGDYAEVAAVEGLRQRWRDAPQDPRIEAAQTVEDLLSIPLPEQS